MLTLNVLDSIQLTSRPSMQIAVGSVIRANYRFPFTKTRVEVENLDNLPSEGRIYIAMNHTDRYNYWPFQVELWKRRDEFTATWVKGKYYNNALMARFMVAANNIPAPSKGYIIAIDAAQVLGHPPSTELYRVLREVHDEGLTFEEARRVAKDAGVEADFDALNVRERDMLGRAFRPAEENFLDAQRALFSRMMDRFVDLNYQAFDERLKILVFPEGTRSRKLGTGRPGLAQMAIRTRATIVPVGCNGSDLAYPGNSPFSRGGTITYRVGKPLTPKAELAPFQIEEEYQPFTPEAEKHAETFAALTDVVMGKIEELLDQEYRPNGSARAVVDGASRFM